MRKVTLHKTDIVLNRERLQEYLDKKGLSYISFYEKVVDAYGLDITYKGFMSLMGNRSSWKLLYAHAMTDVLNIHIEDIFDVTDIDIEDKLKKKAVWREKYEK